MNACFLAGVSEPLRSSKPPNPRALTLRDPMEDAEDACPKGTLSWPGRDFTLYPAKGNTHKSQVQADCADAVKDSQESSLKLF